MEKTFGEALLEQAIRLRFPSSHPYISYLFEAPNNHPYPFPLIGCSEEQISQIMSQQHANRIPAIYREFLLAMGVRCGDVFLGLDVELRYLVSETWPKNLYNLLNREKYYFPERFFVFWSRQGHTFAYFPTDLNDDPPVYIYGEHDEDDPEDLYYNGPLKLEDHLSSFLARFIAERESKAAQEAFLDRYAAIYR